MKKQLLLSILVAWTQGSLAGEPRHQAVESSIESVVVFSDRAMVKRIFTGELNIGQITIEIPDLPSKLLNESVRVAGRGTSQAKISGVRVEKTVGPETPKDEIRELKDKLNQIDRRKKTLDDRLKVLNEKKRFIEIVTRKSSESISKDLPRRLPSATEWLEMAEFVDKGLSSVYDEFRLIEDEKKTLRAQGEVVRNALNKYGTAMDNFQKMAYVDLDVVSQGYFTFEISYIVVGASWKPVYDIRASSDTNTIDIVFMANVRQNTGENWEDIQLELSTARPYVGAVPRMLSPWYLDAIQPEPRAASGPHDIVVTAKKAKIDKYVTSNEESVSMRLGYSMFQTFETQMAVAEVSTQVISTSFILKQAETIPSNNISKKVSVKLASVSAETELFAVPKLTEYAYLKARVVNETSFPLLSGDANVFFDGNFVSTTRIPLVIPTESFDLYLGIDEGIKIKREMIEKFSDETGVLNKKQRIEYRYKILVENFRRTDQKITVLDQFPVSLNDVIDVKVSDISPAPQYKSEEKKKGIMRWVLKLGPLSNEEIRFKYEVKYPVGLMIAGLN